MFWSGHFDDESERCQLRTDKFENDLVYGGHVTATGTNVVSGDLK